VQQRRDLIGKVRVSGRGLGQLGPVGDQFHHI